MEEPHSFKNTTGLSGESNFQVSENSRECLSFGWVEIDTEHKRVKRTLTANNCQVLELNYHQWANSLFEKKLLPRFKQISDAEIETVPSQDALLENRGKEVEVVWIEIDYLEHLMFHPEFTPDQMILALKGLFELQIELQSNGWFIRYPHLGNVTLIPQPMMFDLGDIRKSDICPITPDNYQCIYSTLPDGRMDNVSGYKQFVSHLSTFVPGTPQAHQAFLEEAARLVDRLQVNETENFWDDYRSPGEIPSKENLEEFRRFQPPKSESIASTLLTLEPESVVDVGCSDGYYSFMAEACGATSVLGLDFSEKVINSATKTSIARKSTCKFAHCDLTNVNPGFAKRVYSDFALGAAIMHHLFRAGMSFDTMAALFHSLGKNCMIEYVAPFDMHGLNADKPGHTIENFCKAFSKYWNKIEFLPTIPMGSPEYNEWYQGWLKQNPGAKLKDMPRVWLKCTNENKPLKPLKTSKPLLSIGLAVFNEEKYIRQTLDALLNQDFQDFELLISDNCSTDRTYEICQEYAQKNERINLWQNEKNIGIASLRKILRAAGGKYFMLAGGHDLWEPTYIKSCVEVLERDPDVVLCHAKCAEIDQSGKIGGIMSEPLDTRGLPPEETFPKIWSLKTGVPIYGVMHLDALLKTNNDRGVLGTDIITLCELSAFGSIAYIDNLLLYQRINRAPETADASIKRTLSTMNPGKKKIQYETAWLDLLSAHVEVLAERQLEKQREYVLLGRLMECFKSNYGESPKIELERLATSYIEYFQERRKDYANIGLIREAQVALGYINLGLLLYPSMDVLMRAYTMCSSIITATFAVTLPNVTAGAIVTSIGSYFVRSTTIDIGLLG